MTNDVTFLKTSSPIDIPMQIGFESLEQFKILQNTPILYNQMTIIEKFTAYRDTILDLVNYPKKYVSYSRKYHAIELFFQMEEELFFSRNNFIKMARIIKDLFYKRWRLEQALLEKFSRSEIPDCFFYDKLMSLEEDNRKHRCYFERFYEFYRTFKYTPMDEKRLDGIYEIFVQHLWDIRREPSQILKERLLMWRNEIERMFARYYY